MAALIEIYYGVPNWAIERTSAEWRRAFNFWLLTFWVFVGLPVWLALRDDLWFVGWMSIYAIWTGHLGSWAAETPVEIEES